MSSIPPQQQVQSDCFPLGLLNNNKQKLKLHGKSRHWVLPVALKAAEDEKWKLPAHQLMFERFECVGLATACHVLFSGCPLVDWPTVNHLVSALLPLCRWRSASWWEDPTYLTAPWAGAVLPAHYSYVPSLNSACLHVSGGYEVVYSRICWSDCQTSRNAKRNRATHFEKEAWFFGVFFFSTRRSKERNVVKVLKMKGSQKCEDFGSELVNQRRLWSTQIIHQRRSKTSKHEEQLQNLNQGVWCEEFWESCPKVLF